MSPTPSLDATNAALTLIARAGYPILTRLKNPGLDSTEKLEILAATIVIFSVGLRLMACNESFYNEKLVKSEALVITYLLAYEGLGGIAPRKSTVELLVGGEES